MLRNIYPIQQSSRPAIPTCETNVNGEDMPSILCVRSTADKLDKITMVVAFLAAVANGALLPMFSLLFGMHLA